MCEMGSRLWQRGLIGGAEGNLSCRMPDGTILCTPTGISKGHMRPRDLVCITPSGEPLGEGKPSSEIKLHTRIYARRPDCMAVIHAHPPTATAFTLVGMDIPDDLLPEAAYVLGSVATLPFAMPGTNEVPDGIEPFVEDHKTFLMSHHGAVVMGSDLEDAYCRMETLERVCRMILIARTIDVPQPMPRYAFQHMLEVALSGRL